MKILTIIIAFLLSTPLFAQNGLKALKGNKKFQWVVDSSSTRLEMYYQKEGYTAQHVDKIRDKLLLQMDSVIAFVGISEYKPKLHFFIVEDNQQMKALTSGENNGSANHRFNTISGVMSEKTNSHFFNHEIFHVIAADTWGYPTRWINEGMAVYSDKQWQGYDLYQLTKYLVDNHRYIPLDRLIKKFRKTDPTLSYPLVGSFVRYLEETYGREVVLNIWKNDVENFQQLTGKSNAELEQDWLAKAKASSYGKINY